MNFLRQAVQLIALQIDKNKFLKEAILVIEAGLQDHAKTELDLAGLFDQDSDYNGMIGDAVMELIDKFSDQGHSGFSAEWTLSLFNDVARFKPLTPITSNPDEWEDVSGYSVDNDPLWQNKRAPMFFSEDGGETWYDVGE